MRQKILLTLLLFFLVLISCSCGSSPTVYQPSSTPNAADSAGPQSDPAKLDPTKSLLKVHILDVGQADSILVQFPDNKNMLIDGGDSEDGPTIISYLEKQGVKKIDYLVATHPHKDHIGGLDEVIDRFPIGEIYIPAAKTSTDTFMDLLVAIKNRGLKANLPTADHPFLQSNDLRGEFIIPSSAPYEELNDESIVVRIVYGRSAFLFMGDAEKDFEQRLLTNSSAIDVRSDVLKVAHHGSKSGTTRAFLQRVSPRFAVISVGAHNDYDHPHKKILDRLAQAGTKIYRTDLDGTVVFYSDGKDITVKTGQHKLGAEQAVSDTKTVPLADQPDAGYIGNIKSKKLHRADCNSLPAENNRIYFTARDEAIKQGYIPSQECNP